MRKDEGFGNFKSFPFFALCRGRGGQNTHFSLEISKGKWVGVR